MTDIAKLFETEVFMIDYIYLLLVAAGNSLQSCLTKLYQSRTVNSSMKTSVVVEKSFFFGMALSSVAWIILITAKRFKPEITVFSAVSALIMAAGGTLTNIFGIMALSRGKISVYSLFLLLGGMMLPFLADVVFWGENLSALRITGLIFLVAALVFPILEKKDVKNAKNVRIFFLLCLGIFLANGMNSIVAKYHQAAPVHVDTVSFMVLRETINAPLNALLFLFMRIRNNKGNKNAAGSANNARFIAVNWLILSIFAAIYCGSHFCNLLAAGIFDASLQFPVITGGTMILVAAAGFIFFREKPGKYLSASIAAAFFATILFGLS